MNPKHFLKCIAFILAVVFCFTVKSSFGQDSATSQQAIKEWLTVPFGTLVKMNVEIFDGNERNDKSHQSSFLFRVKSVEGITFSTPIIIEFKDETGNFPNEESGLYEYLYGKKTGTISSKESEKMKKKYVGKEFNIIAYETGEFTGIPKDYYKYQPVRQDYGFHFRHYLIVVANLTMRTD